MTTHPDTPGSCVSCTFAEAHSRRDFLRIASLAAAVAGLTLPTTTAFAEPLRFVSPLSRDRSTVTYPVPPKDGVEIDRKNDVILVRAQNAVYAFNLACPHQNTALRFDTKNNRFECPKHHSRYMPDGTFIEGRATRGMDRFRISREGEKLLVDLDVLYEQDKKRNEWMAASVKLS